MKSNRRRFLQCLSLAPGLTQVASAEKSEGSVAEKIGDAITGDCGPIKAPRMHIEYRTRDGVWRQIKPMVEFGRVNAFRVKP